MDSLRTLPAITDHFHTPVRFLLPKLLKGRDDWKSKSQKGLVRNKTLQINVRDLTASREAWRTEYEKLLEVHGQLRAERDQLQIRVDTSGRESADTPQK